MPELSKELSKQSVKDTVNEAANSAVHGYEKSKDMAKAKLEDFSADAKRIFGKVKTQAKAVSEKMPNIDPWYQASIGAAVTSAVLFKATDRRVLATLAAVAVPCFFAIGFLRKLASDTNSSTDSSTAYH